MQAIRILGKLSLCFFAIVACSELPRGAGLQTEILNVNESQPSDFAVYAVNRDLLKTITHWPKTGSVQRLGWLSQQHRLNSANIAAGDIISLSVWDSEENSLLSAPGQKTVAINNLAVSPDGSIFVPYIDKISVAGLSIDDARELIQNQMETIIPAAQVQLAVVTGRNNSVDLIGGVASPGSYPIPDDHFSVLSLVSVAGGIPSASRNPQVRLVRSGRVYGTSLSRIYENPNLDTILQGGDKVFVEQDERYFLSLGAAGSEKLFYFQKDQITALEAMSIIGGISDNRGNPQGILILREYPGNAVKSNSKGPSQKRTVFTVDLTTADGLFSAQNFQIFPEDTVLVTEAPVIALNSILNLFGSALGIANKLQ